MILKKLGKFLGLRNAQDQDIRPANIQLGAVTREVSDEEYQNLLAQRRQAAKDWKALSKEEQNAIQAVDRRKKAAANKARMIGMGIEKFQWVYAGGRHECEACKRNDGKVFSVARLPKSGFPGDGRCCPDGICNCYAHSIIPGFEP